MRTPVSAGEVDARLHREDGRARQRLVRGASDRLGRSWVASPIPWPVPWPKSRPVAGGLDDVAGGRVQRPPGWHGPPRATPLDKGDRPLPGPAPPGRRPQGRGPPARRRRASASCRCGSPPPGPRSRRGAPGRPARAAPRRAVGQGGLRAGEGGHVEGERLGAALAHEDLQAPGERASVTPGRISGSRAARARSATAAAAAIRSISAVSLTARSSSIHGPAPDQLDVGRGRCQRLPERVRQVAPPGPPPGGPRSRPRARASAPAGRSVTSSTRASGASRRPGACSASRQARRPRRQRPGSGRSARRPSLRRRRGRRPPGSGSPRAAARSRRRRRPPQVAPGAGASRTGRAARSASSQARRRRPEGGGAKSAGIGDGPRRSGAAELLDVLEVLGVRRAKTVVPSLAAKK